MNRALGFVFSMTLAALSVASFAQGVAIPQVPANAQPTDNEESAINASNHGNTGDYQSQILSDPNLNERARAQAVMNEGQDTGLNDGIAGNAEAARGNTAVIVQRGKSNASSITQTGDNNYASQTQMGNHNDLTVEQTGKN